MRVKGGPPLGVGQRVDGLVYIEWYQVAHGDVVRVNTVTHQVVQVQDPHSKSGRTLVEVYTRRGPGVWVRGFITAWLDQEVELLAVLDWRTNEERERDHER